MANSQQIQIDNSKMIDIQVCYVADQSAVIRQLNMKCDATIRDAIECSQILQTFSEININQCKVGIFGKIKLLNTILQQGDRVEIYRPLVADPMDARRRRAVKKTKNK